MISAVLHASLMPFFSPKSIPSSSKVKGRRYNCVEVKVSIMWAWGLGKQQDPLDTFRIQRVLLFFLFLDAGQGLVS